MMKQHYRLFNVGPQKSSLGVVSPAVETQLLGFCEQIRQLIGVGKQITLFPHRVVQNHWAIELSGEQGSVHLLLNVTGRSLLPTSNYREWPARLVIEIADHVDAYWFATFLAQQLDLKSNLFFLSTSIVDNSMHNEVTDTNEA
ncbi:TPA: hypothetical protein PXA21_002393 [Mannheimia haemolytica]|uniref:hypothetical protein n=1 Tax=Mannheimia haemolytica TaxID=75985 RepID=UPI0011BB8E00|nr:hypothetical protein [Mannheimia haemolytica]QEA94566.1 hypothetical protein BG581_08490 [Mannheimia haemolytica]HDL4371570.1 hypothetical protein [Mannheimia haemolytica]HDL5006977.1 hypothetical protein [Mannheimia haemolytica]